MTADLYQQLGVARSASAAEIRTAYKRAAKRAHPDAGGSSAAFAALKLAYDVLRDPARRARYDAEGVVRPSQPDNSEAMALALIAGKLQEAVNQLVQQGARPEQNRLVESIRWKLEQLSQETVKALAGIDKASDIWRALEPRFHTKRGKPNHISAMIRTNLEELRAHRERHEAQQRTISRALELLDDYTFDAAAPSPMAQMPCGLWGTTAWR